MKYTLFLNRKYIVCRWQKRGEPRIVGFRQDINGYPKPGYKYRGNWGASRCGGEKKVTCTGRVNGETQGQFLEQIKYCTKMNRLTVIKTIILRSIINSNWKTFNHNVSTNLRSIVNSHWEPLLTVSLLISILMLISLGIVVCSC